jgi:hypothetical protein
MQTETLANDVFKTRLSSQVAASASLKQKEMEKVLSKMVRRNPVKEIFEINEYNDLLREHLRAKASGDVEKQNQIFHNIKMLETNEVLLRTHSDNVIVMTEAAYQVAFNGANKHEKQQWQTLRPRWLGWRQRISFKNEIGCDWTNLAGTQEALNVISQVLVSDILKQVEKYKSNGRIGDVVYSEKKEKLEFVTSRPYRAWLHNEYNANGSGYSPLKLQLIVGLAEGKFDEAFADIDFESLTESERQELKDKLTPSSKKETKKDV